MTRANYYQAHKPQKKREPKEKVVGDIFAEIFPAGLPEHRFTWWRNGWISYRHISWPEHEIEVIAENRFDYVMCRLQEVMQHYMKSDCGHWRDYRTNRVKHLLDPAIITERRSAAKKFGHVAERHNRRIQPNERH